MTWEIGPKTRISQYSAECSAKKSYFSVKKKNTKIAENRRFLAIILHYFRCIFKNFAQIEKINIDSKTNFDGGYGQLTHYGTWWLYGGVFFYYRSLGGCCRFSNDGSRTLFL